MRHFKTFRLVKFILLVSLVKSLSISSIAYADWKINSEQSGLQFVSIKKDTVGEINHFTRLSGSLTDAGVLSVSIDLASVETGIDIRNTRMQEHLFETKQFPFATINAQVDTELIKSLKKGVAKTASIPFELNLHGKKVQLTANVFVTRLKGKLLVTTNSPILINAEDFELAAGINKLKELAGLPSIATSVPVTVQLLLE
jgi:polyisoprenoid-binding protein YceI